MSHYLNSYLSWDCMSAGGLLSSRILGPHIIILLIADVGIFNVCRQSGGVILLPNETA